MPEKWRDSLSAAAHPILLMNEQCIVHPRYTHFFNYLYNEVTGKASIWPEEEIKLHTFNAETMPTCKCKPTVQPIVLDGTGHYAGVYHKAFKIPVEQLG